ncbi:acyltransferase 3 [Rhodopirellula maiorica SM1]|uniref:Acyltransferase 3 n=1 Tax=Rhodopirellula maiorica SM1 TaxID=1265738 RepID=M5R7W0_9BACT|nr:acyltransferase family protein [Rhodopirellula maiorica]EMI15573.1 acyltransferase 3 [Rhodopirellula maiorica SM1]
MTPGSFRLFLGFVVVIHHSFPLRMGAWAVGMFFVLSGYWISRMWRGSYSRKPSPYRTFLISRWWRIAPLFVVIQLLAAALVLSGVSGDHTSVIEDWRWWLTQPAVIGSTQFGRLLPPSWSLDVEMQFYLVAPIMLMVATRFVFSRKLAVGRGQEELAVGSGQEELAVGSWRKKGRELVARSWQLVGGSGQWAVAEKGPETRLGGRGFFAAIMLMGGLMGWAFGDSKVALLWKHLVWICIFGCLPSVWPVRWLIGSRHVAVRSLVPPDC